MSQATSPMKNMDVTIKRPRLVSVNFKVGLFYSSSHEARATPNDPKLSDRGARRGTCTVGGKAAVEAGAVTCGAVRCSAWLGDSVVVRLIGFLKLGKGFASKQTNRRKLQTAANVQMRRGPE